MYLQKYPRGRRGSPAKGVGCLINAARVQIPPSAPARRKRQIACDELFPFRAKLIARSFCCSSLPTMTRSAAVGGFAALWMRPAPCGYCAGLAVGCRPAGGILHGRENIDFDRPFQPAASVRSLAAGFFLSGQTHRASLPHPAPEGRPGNRPPL